MYFRLIFARLGWHGRPSGHFREVRDVGRSVRGRAGIIRGSFRKFFGFSRRVPVFKKVEDRSPLNSKVSVRRVPVFKIVEDRSLLIRE